MASLVGAALLVIGGLGPWVKFGLLSVAGTEGDGWFVVAAGAVAGGLLVRFNANRGRRDRLDWLIPVAGAVGAVIVLIDLVEILNTDLITAGWGAWAAAIGGVVLVGASVYLLSPTTRGRTAAGIAAVAIAAAGVAIGIATEEDSETNPARSDSGSGSGENIFETEPEDDRAPPPPRIQVTESGFSQDDSGVSFAALLKNSSTDTAGTEVTVTANFLDEAGTVISTTTATVAVIAPGSTFGVGGSDFIERERAAKVQVTAKAAEGSDDQVEAVRPAKARVIAGEFDRTARAEITNAGDKPISSINDVFYVFRDSAGSVVGGGQTFPEGDIPPNGKAAVEATDVPDAATRADVFVDPES